MDVYDETRATEIDDLDFDLETEDIVEPLKNWDERFGIDIVETPAFRDVPIAGIMLDDVNMAWRFGTSTGATAQPIDPRTGQLFKKEN